MSVSSRVSLLLAPVLVRKLPLGLQSYISQRGLVLRQISRVPFLRILLSLSCQTSSPSRPTRAPLRPSAPSQRMLSERQTQVIQVSFCSILNQDRDIEVFVTFRSSLGAPMGMAPVTHVLFTRSVYRLCARAPRFIGRFAQILQC